MYVKEDGILPILNEAIRMKEKYVKGLFLSEDRITKRGKKAKHVTRASIERITAANVSNISFILAFSSCRYNF